jgi:hypothetical protein
VRCKEEILHKLLRDGGCAARDLAGLTTFLRDFSDLFPINAAVFIEAPVFGGDNGVLQVGRDAVQGDETLLLAVATPGEEGRESTLELHPRRRWIEVAKHE